MVRGYNALLLLLLYYHQSRLDSPPHPLVIIPTLFVSLTSPVSIHLLIHLSTHLSHHLRSSLLHSFTPGSKSAFSKNPSHLK